MTHTPERSFSVFAGGAAMVVARLEIKWEYFFARSGYEYVYKSVCVNRAE